MEISFLFFSSIKIEKKLADSGEIRHMVRAESTSCPASTILDARAATLDMEKRLVFETPGKLWERGRESTTICINMEIIFPVKAISSLFCETLNRNLSVENCSLTSISKGESEDLLMSGASDFDFVFHFSKIDLSVFRESFFHPTISIYPQCK